MAYSIETHDNAGAAQQHDVKIVVYAGIKQIPRQQLITALQSIEKRLFPKSELMDFEQEVFVKSRTNSLLLAIASPGQDSRVVGYLVHTNGKADNCARITKVAVAPDYQRRGIGLQLVGRAIASIADQGRGKIGLHVDADRRAGAMKLYEKAGFSKVKKLENYYGNGRHAWWMEYKTTLA